LPGASPFLPQGKPINVFEPVKHKNVLALGKARQTRYEIIVYVQFAGRAVWIRIPGTVAKRFVRRTDPPDRTQLECHEDFFASHSS
jgi:adenosine/AMP kinase